MVIIPVMTCCYSRMQDFPASLTAAMQTTEPKKKMQLMEFRESSRRAASPNEYSGLGVRERAPGAAI